MVPASPYDNESQAEKRVFERLRTAFDEGYTAFHSLKPTRHPHKRFPEIDFVICSAEGLYVLEVKGGGITLHDGVWQYQDRYGRSTPSHEGPFRQAERALHGLMDDLRANVPEYVLRRFTTGYGVVFPDCEWSGDSAEWDPEMVADMRRSRDLEGWLCKLFDYWRDRGGRRQRPDARDIERLQTYLRPEVDASAPGNAAALYEQVEDAQCAHRAADRRPDADGPCRRGESTSPLRGWCRHRQDVPRRATRAALGRCWLAGGARVPLALAATLPRVPPSHLGIVCVAHRRCSPRLSTGRAGTV